jgi:hypothetical protein
MCGDTLDDGVEILFRESTGSKLPENASRPNKNIQAHGEKSQYSPVSDSEGVRNEAHSTKSGDGSHADDTADENLMQRAQGSAEWSHNLGELSEGQRSICALVFVMSAAAAGVKPAVLLVDEVDAALGAVHMSASMCIVLDSCSVLGSSLTLLTSPHGCKHVYSSSWLQCSEIIPHTSFKAEHICSVFCRWSEPEPCWTTSCTGNYSALLSCK